MTKHSAATFRNLLTMLCKTFTTVGILLALATSSIRGEHRVALVIGNYQYAKAELASSRNDIKVISTTLKSLGFRVTHKENVNEKQLKSAIEFFVQSAPTRGTALVYFNGYALAGDYKGNQDTFLTPIDGNMSRPREIGQRGIGIAQLLGRLDTEGGCTNNLILVDGQYQHPEQDKDHSMISIPQAIPENAFLGLSSKIGELAQNLSMKIAKSKESPLTVFKKSCSRSKSTLPDTILTNKANQTVAQPDEFPIGKKAGDEWVNAKGMVFCWCPPGTYTMGSPIDLSGRFEDEPQVEVTIKDGFWISKYELTIRENPRGTPRNVLGGHKNHPVTLINFDDATRMTRKTLTEAERKAGRLPKDWEYALPTEQQWEYAARAGSTSRYHFGNDEKELPHYANFADKSLYNTGNFYYNYAHRSLNDGTVLVAKVGQYKPNPWGLHDVYGNVAEWCEKLQMRGGSYLSKANYCRSSVRNTWPNRSQRNFLGFRLVIRKAQGKIKR